MVPGAAVSRLAATPAVHRVARGPVVAEAVVHTAGTEFAHRTRVSAVMAHPTSRTPKIML